MSARQMESKAAPTKQLTQLLKKVLLELRTSDRQTNRLVKNAAGVWVRKHETTGRHVSAESARAFARELPSTELAQILNDPTSPPDQMQCVMEERLRRRLW